MRPRRLRAPSYAEAKGGQKSGLVRWPPKRLHFPPSQWCPVFPVSGKKGKRRGEKKRHLIKGLEARAGSPGKGMTNAEKVYTRALAHVRHTLSHTTTSQNQPPNPGPGATVARSEQSPEAK